MKSNHTRVTVVALALALALTAACGQRRAEEARCAQCGMRIEGTSRWRAGLTTRGGEKLSFDAPKCMLRTLVSARGRGARDAWVLEYYGGHRIRAAAATFVTGSDVLGPMGPDLVPLADRAAAERFAVDHGNRALVRLGEIDLRLLDAL